MRVASAPAELGTAPAGSDRPEPLVPVFPSPHSAKILDLLLGAMVIGRGAVPGFPNGTFAQLAFALLVLVAVFRRPIRMVPLWYPAVCLGLMAYLVIASLANSVDPTQRALNIGLSMIVAAFLISGRVDAASLVKGIGVALVVNAVAFYAGFAPDDYGGKLTGFLLDKNAAGMFYAIVPLLLVAVLPRTWQRVAVLAAGAAGVILTDSRTSMAAFGLALVWMTLAPLLRGYAKVGLAGLMLGVFLWTEANLATYGRYAVERAGSDALRERIAAAAEAKLAVSPWYGSGLGESTVVIGGSRRFFHNSYSALLVEGGWIFLAVVLGLYLLGFGLLSQGHRSRQRWAVSAATGALALCATQLGEVFLSQFGFVVLGIGLALAVENRPYRPSPWVFTQPGTRLLVDVPGKHG